MALFQEYSRQTSPFYESVLQKGLPYFAAETQYSTSDLAKQINQAKAGLRGRLAGYGGALPSGFAEQSERDLEAGGAEAFDQNMLSLLAQNFAARMSAAQALNPQAPAAGAAAGFQSVLQAPLQNTFWSNLLGGVISAAGRAASGGAFGHLQEGSAYIPETGPKIVHEGEMVIPADLADKIRRKFGSQPKPVPLARGKHKMFPIPLAPIRSDPRLLKRM